MQTGGGGAGTQRGGDNVDEHLYTDEKGVDLKPFFKNILTSSQKTNEKNLLISLEQDMTGFVQDPRYVTNFSRHFPLLSLIEHLF